MSTDIYHLAASADAAAGALSALSGQKRKNFDGSECEPELKHMKYDGPPQTWDATVPPTTTICNTTNNNNVTKTTVAPQSSTFSMPPMTIDTACDTTKSVQSAGASAAGAGKTPSKGREIRLEQNRKAARESRRRKKCMIEELQRSVIFFSRANGTLKQHNEELSRLLIQAQAHVAGLNGETKLEEMKPAPVVTKAPKPAPQPDAFQQAQAERVAKQAVYESQGYPAAAARAAAQTTTATAAPVPAAPAPATTNTTSTTNTNTDVSTKAVSMLAHTAAAATPAPQPSATSLQSMQVGATMQAMANFQQAAASAMQTAMKGMMEAIPGVNVNQLAATPMGVNPQQAFTDTMTALAMQQAAAAAGQHFMMHPGMPFFAYPMLAWQHQLQALSQQPFPVPPRNQVQQQQQQHHHAEQQPQR